MKSSQARITSIIQRREKLFTFWQKKTYRLFWPLFILWRPNPGTHSNNDNICAFWSAYSTTFGPLVFTLNKVIIIVSIYYFFKLFLSKIKINVITKHTSVMAQIRYLNRKSEEFYCQCKLCVVKIKRLS